MSSTFFGLTIAGSGLNAFQASINTTANNIANEETEGYARQKVVKEAAGALRVWQKFGSTSTGVVASSIESVRDKYYDEKYWINQGDFGYYDKKQYYMQQIEDYFNDKGDAAPGFSTIFADMFNALEGVQTAAGDLSQRTAFVSEAQKTVDYFNNTAVRLENLQSSINDEVKTTVDQVNAIAQKIALINKQINVIEMQGGIANDLRDSRALLIDDLSKIVRIETDEQKVRNTNNPDMYTGATTFTVKINGQTLVDTYEYNPLECRTREDKYNQSDIDGLYDVIWKKSGMRLNVISNNQSGSLKALFEMRDGNDYGNLRGTFFATESDTTTVSIINPSISKVEYMTMPEKGVITVNNTQYHYDYFSAEYRTKEYEVNGETVKLPILYDEAGNEIGYDEEGNPLEGGGTPVIDKYNFHLTEGIVSSKLTQYDGMTVTVGSSIATKGVPFYQNQLNQFVRAFAKAFNDIHEQGEDVNGKEAEAFFVANSSMDESQWKFESQRTYRNGEYDDGTTQSYGVTDDAGNHIPSYIIGVYNDPDSDPPVMLDNYYMLTAKTMGVNANIKRDVNMMATTAKISNGIDNNELVSSMLSLESGTILFRGGSADKFLQCIYADVTVDAQEADVFSGNYENILKQIDKQRQSVMGVDEDDEAMDLVRFQNAYNLSSKIISVLAEMYDQLILRTGV